MTSSNLESPSVPRRASGFLGPFRARAACTDAKSVLATTGPMACVARAAPLGGARTAAAEAGAVALALSASAGTMKSGGSALMIREPFPVTIASRAMTVAIGRGATTTAAGGQPGVPQASRRAADARIKRPGGGRAGLARLSNLRLLEDCWSRGEPRAWR
jgi:hypothetical protein